MVERALRIAWVGAGPGHEDSGGVPGVANDLLHGLAGLGHEIDVFMPSAGHELPERIRAHAGIEVVWGTSEWRWNRWYSRSRITAFASGLIARGFASWRLRRALAERNARRPYDVVYSLSNIETPAVPAGVARRVPLAIHPETHSMGELRYLISERRLALSCMPPRTFAIALALMASRSLAQRVRIRRARLLVCISGVFRDHLVRDYGFPVEHTVVVPNPVRLSRFAGIAREPGATPTVLVLGRVAVRKGVEDVVALARELHARGSQARVRIVGGPGLWSDYTALLRELPPNAEYAGRIKPGEIPGELARADVLLQASRYEPFALTVAEALAAGVPVVATSEVGASEGVDAQVLSRVGPGDVTGMADALEELIGRSREQGEQLAQRARAEAARLWAPEVVCRKLADALGSLADRR